PTRWESTSTRRCSATRTAARGAARCRAPARPDAPRPTRSADQQLGDLHRVERSALAEVVVAEEQHQTAAAVDRGVLADAADVARILAGRLERSGHIAQHHTGCGTEHLDGAGDADR